MQREDLDGRRGRHSVLRLVRRRGARAALRRRRRGQRLHVGRHREHLPRRPGRARVGQRDQAGRRDTGDRRALLGPSRAQQGRAPARPLRQARPRRCGPPGRRGGHGGGHHARHRHALRLGAHLLARPDRSRRAAGRPRRAPRPLAPRGRLRGRHPGPLRARPRPSGPRLRLRDPRRHLHLRRSAQVGLRRQAGLDGHLPHGAPPRAGALLDRRVAERALQRRDVHGHAPRRGHRRRVGGAQLPGPGGLPADRRGLHARQGADDRRPRAHPLRAGVRRARPLGLRLRLGRGRHAPGGRAHERARLVLRADDLAARHPHDVHARPREGRRRVRGRHRAGRRRGTRAGEQRPRRRPYS